MHTDGCTYGSMRLVGTNGPNKVEGRVEYCSNGVWGTVSSSGFDVNDGKVVCRRLGHQEPRNLRCTLDCDNFSLFYIGVLIFRNYGQGSGPVVFVNLDCNGNELTLDDCTFSLNLYRYYTHYFDDVAAVRCMEKGFVMLYIISFNIFS